MFGFGHKHSWSQWADYETINVYGDGFGNMTELPVRRELIQVRSCTECKKKQYHKSKY